MRACSICKPSFFLFLKLSILYSLPSEWYTEASKVGIYRH